MISNTAIAEKPAMDTAFLRPKSPNERVGPVAELFKAPVLTPPSAEAPKAASGDKDTAPAWKKVLDQIESKSCWLALGANFLGALMMKMGFSEAVQKRIEKLVTTILKMSFLPYGLSGIADGYVRNNIFTMLGFTGELFFPWLANLKNLYLIRGLPTGTDQLWTATDHHVSHKDGIFPDFKTGFFEVIKALGKLTKEIFTQPVKSLLTLKTKGHHAFLSSCGSAAATIGYALTGKDKIFGLLRDFSGPLFDWGMLLEKEIMKKASGVLFLFESAFDLLARHVAKANHNKLAFNMLSQGSGRLALMLYKNSSPVATVKI
jgi:hypothetical protein